MSELLALGVSYRTAPVEIRERLAMSDENAVSAFLQDLRGVADVHEAVVLSTCNRTELYLVVGDPVEAESAALAMLARRAGIRPTELSSVIYAHRNCEAARHLYRVGAGLESMVVGEAEIQGQIKRAYDAALVKETAGPLTSRLFTAALSTGKRVRSETEIGAGHLSLPAVAAMLAREQLGQLSGRQVVLVGTGETSELTARALADSGVHTVFVANRRRERALQLARRHGGDTVGFDELPDAMLRADIVVTATSSPHLLLEREELADVMSVREGRPLMIIDLAVPRDVEHACGELPGVSLFDIDDLQAVVSRNRRVRQAEARKAEGIVEEEIGHFAQWLGSLEVLPTVAALRSHAAAIAEGVVAENAGRWETASPRDRQRVDAIAQAIVNRLMHEPTTRMKNLRDDRVHARMQLLRELFALDAGESADADFLGALPGGQSSERLIRSEPLAPEQDDEPLAEIRALRRR